MDKFHKFEVQGFATVANVLDESTVANLLSELEQRQNHANSDQSNRMYALRNLFQALPSIRKLATSPNLHTLLEPLLGKECFAVRALYFDKIPDANWKVPWHQDLTVALKQRHETEGFGSWTHKEGILHAQAPASLLEQMVTLRLHLDPCPKENGALHVLPGSHRQGKLSPSKIQTLREEVGEVICEVERGGVLMMRPLLLHSSSEAHSPNHRRVIHIEYANTPLPSGLEWYEKV